MGNGVLQIGLLATAQESRNQIAKSTEMGMDLIVAVTSIKIADIILLRIQVLNCVKIWLVPYCEVVKFFIFKNRVFMLWIFQICALPTWKDFYFLMFNNRIFGWELFKYGWCHPETGRLITSQESRFKIRNVQIFTVPSCKKVYLPVIRKRLFRHFRNGQCCPADTQELRF